jgi:hypothetical protein
MQETDLYAPVKTFLERQGYSVKAEVKDCDVVAVRGDEPPVIVELKTSFSISLLLQGVDRQAVSDWVYIAFPLTKARTKRGQIADAVKLCRRLGIGLMTVRLEPSELVQVHCDPGAYQPRKIPRRTASLLREFDQRVGDPNTGGQNRRAIVTAYRQDALRIAAAISNGEVGKPASLKKTLGVEKAATILSQNHYGWFFRMERGLYGLSPTGHEALKTYADHLV